MNTRKSYKKYIDEVHGLADRGKLEYIGDGDYCIPLTVAQRKARS